MSLTLAIILASIAEFIVGAIWYTPIFGNVWGKIHGFDPAKMSKDEVIHVIPHTNKNGNAAILWRFHSVPMR